MLTEALQVLRNLQSRNLKKVVDLERILEIAVKYTLLNNEEIKLM